MRNAESDRALEMLATAAWWLDDVASSITARERLFRLRRERGDGRIAQVLGVSIERLVHD